MTLCLISGHRRSQFAHGGRCFRRTEEGSAAHKKVGAVLFRDGGGVGVDAAIDLQVILQSMRVTMSLAAASLGMVSFSMKGWPPKPGTTVITSSRSIMSA